MNEREQLVAYLLGELPEEEQSRIEQGYLANDSGFEDLLVVEDELAYDYLQGRLSPIRRERFEQTIASTSRGLKNLEFARAVLDTLQLSRRTARRPTMMFWSAGIAAALALAVVPLWLATRVNSLTAQVERLRTESATAQARLEGELARKGVTPVEAAFLLSPGRSRGETSAPLELSASADIIRLDLVLPPGAPQGDYAVILSTAQGTELWSRAVTVTGRTLAATVPAKLFTSGDYRIAVRRLTAGEPAPDLAVYSLRLTRK